MPSFNAKTINAKVRTGNAVSILVGDTPVGFAQTSSNSIGFGAEAFFGIGSSKRQEIQQQKIEPNITLDSLALTDEGISYFGYSTSWINILCNTELTLSILDNKGSIMLSYIGCTASDFNQSIPANQPITEATNFMALDVLDSTGTSVLNSGTDALVVNIASAAASTAVNAVS